MHHILNPSYVHGNIKSRNIFLDEDFSAKLGNFGMPKCSLTETEDQESWNKGYLAPEYQNEGKISPNLDIFAYGVVLLEVLSGKPPLIRDEERENGSFIKLSDEIKRVLETENAEELRGWIDSGLGENYSFDGAVNLANLARSCVEEDPSLRPNAGEIVEKLLRLVDEEGDHQVDICESSCKPLVKADEEER
ncbi:Non-specific serine/threonine protein kinase [Handroanthus impetiginosus]|uniref:Non-specific serine/threonine protein kinase n=1 Tax=Handroanthus impetiginosus TaxID=429701 RepID=A0A2G9G4B3_9LAMI|nr:Non-specific serine/threonine protein kinase [Handroanthus impetiginosus]